MNFAKCRGEQRGESSARLWHESSFSLVWHSPWSSECNGLLTATILSSPGRYSGTWVIRANMRGKLFVALQLEVLHHFIKRITSGRARRVKHPSTFRATKTPKKFPIDPHKPAEHPMERPIVWNKHGVGPQSCLSLGIRVFASGCASQRTGTALRRGEHHQLDTNERVTVSELGHILMCGDSQEPQQRQGRHYVSDRSA